MTIRYAVPADVPALSAVEAECFPPAEAATAAEFAERVAHYGNHFWLMYNGDKLISFVDGFVTDDADLTDEMYENAAIDKAYNGLQGWVDCFEKAELKGYVFGKGIAEPGDAKNHTETLLDAYNLGQSL